MFAVCSTSEFSVSTRSCQVSFTDTDNIVHVVEVSASTLFEAAVLVADAHMAGCSQSCASQQADINPDQS
jgi:sulfite reductase beta subunit-like hemoprotein